ncbi:MAG: NAD-dependent epimerase/dehydratase family protein [Thiohalocapsa sp.]
MPTYLVTGADGFLGYHVVKALNARGDRPRVLVAADADHRSPALRHLNALDIDLVEGNLDDPPSLATACAGVDVIFHTAFAIALGGGIRVEETLRQGNLFKTLNLLDAAAAADVTRVIVSSSSLTVGLNATPEPLNEAADWPAHAFELPYALSRREAELAALAHFSAGEGPEVIAINPSFTLGPEDFLGAPANGLVKRMAKPGFRIRLPIGFGVLDVRDYARGALLAAEHGQHGQRYLLSSHNLDSDRLVREVAVAAGIQPPGWQLTLRPWLLRPIVVLLNLWNRLRGKPPVVSMKLFQLWDHYAWYDNSRACTELGWEPMLLQQSLRDTIDWQRSEGTE